MDKTEKISSQNNSLQENIKVKDKEWIVFVDLQKSYINKVKCLNFHFDNTNLMSKKISLINDL